MDLSDRMKSFEEASRVTSLAAHHLCGWEDI